jgi:polar amino acid transport system substrate-binding protein
MKPNTIKLNIFNIHHSHRLKQLLQSVLLFLCVITITSSAQAILKERRTLTIAADYWCPYNCLPEDENQGFLVELTRRAMHIYGIDIEYKMVPWHKALIMLEKNEIEGLIGVSSLDGRNLISTNIPMAYSASHSFTRSDNNWVYDGVPSLRGKKLSFILDYILDEEISDYFGRFYSKKPSLFKIEDDENAVVDSILNLIDGDADVFIEDKKVVDYITKNNGLNSYVRDAGKVSNKSLPIYIGFSKDVADIKTIIGYLEEGIASLKATGEYDHLLEKYRIEE